jgi:hypothetical protein
MLEPYKVRYVAEIANEKVAEKMEWGAFELHKQ